MSLTKQDLTNVGNLIDKKLEPINKGQVKIQKDINMLIGFFDTELVHHHKRLNRLEDHLHLPPLS